MLPTTPTLLTLLPFSYFLSFVQTPSQCHHAEPCWDWGKRKLAWMQANSSVTLPKSNYLLISLSIEKGPCFKINVLRFNTLTFQFFNIFKLLSCTRKKTLKKYRKTGTRGTHFFCCLRLQYGSAEYSLNSWYFFGHHRFFALILIF